MKPRNIIITAAVTLAAGTATVAPAAIADVGDGHAHDRASTSSTTAELSRGERKEIATATRKYRRVDAAIAAGYQPTEACVAHPELGGMGYHYVNPEYLMDGVVDPTKPDILVFYRNERGKLRLGAVEYFVADADQDLATDADRPYLHGHPFDGPMPGHEPGMPVHYDLHVWLYKDNPAGQLAAWNPAVSCP